MIVSLVYLNDLNSDGLCHLQLHKLFANIQPSNFLYFAYNGEDANTGYYVSQKLGQLAIDIIGQVTNYIK